MHTQLIRSFQIVVLLSFMVALPLRAQQHIMSGRVNIMMVPSSAGFVYIDIKGGDGGDASTHVSNTYCNAKGGSGAVVRAIFKVGNGTDEIPVGSTLRFIKGEKGESEEFAGVVGSGTAGGGGGGGSAVLYRRPDATSDDDWIILAVAGGGGGGYSGMFAFSCTDVHPGKGGMNTTAGGSGKVQSSPDMSGGMDGNAGGNFSETSGGGAGAFENAEKNTENGAPAQKGYPSGGDGAHCAGCQSGGWGFGGGGFSFYGPGGGGGYSGGGAGSIGEAGGGGSYLHNMSYSIYMEAGENGGGSQDGYMKYMFLDPGVDFLGPLQTLTTVQFAFNPGKCIDDYGSNTGNGTNIQTYTCTSNPNQQWYFNAGDRTIRSKLNLDKCLDLSNSSTNNGTNIQLYRCNGSSAQQWVYNGIHKTIHSVMNFDKCFEAANGVANSSSNVNIRLWDCNYSNTNEQKWTINSSSAVSSAASVKHIVPVLAPNFAVHSHTGAESGSNIQLWTKDNTNTAEQWYFDGLAFKLINYHNLCIDLSQSNTNNGNNIQLYSCNGTNAQKWIYDGMTKNIRSVVNPDKCMQIELNTDGVYGKRSNVNIHDCNASVAQQFLIQE